MIFRFLYPIPYAVKCLGQNFFPIRKNFCRFTSEGCINVQMVNWFQSSIFMKKLCLLQVTESKSKIPCVQNTNLIRFKQKPGIQNNANTFKNYPKKQNFHRKRKMHKLRDYYITDPGQCPAGRKVIVTSRYPVNLGIRIRFGSLTSTGTIFLSAINDSIPDGP